MEIDLPAQFMENFTITLKPGLMMGQHIEAYYSIVFQVHVPYFILNLKQLK